MKKPKKSRYWIRYPDQPRQGPQPDGDTVSFQPDDVALVRALPRFFRPGPQHQQMRHDSRALRGYRCSGDGIDLTPI